jgi:hypothetical protein
MANLSAFSFQSTRSVLSAQSSRSVLAWRERGSSDGHRPLDRGARLALAAAATAAVVIMAARVVR